MAQNTEIKMDIIKDYGVISEKNGYELRLRKISWNDRDAKFDIRPWKEDKCGKGITLTDEELKGLLDKLKELDKRGIFKDVK